MRFLALSLLLPACAATAQEACDDVWFTRNLHFDRAGYCFGSPLGQALFDNRDCIGTSVTLGPAAKRQVEEIRQIEAQHGCKVDTNRGWLGIADLHIRRQMVDLPIRDEFESACLGWAGAPLPLRAGIGTHNPVAGQIMTGDYVLFSFLPANGWSYVTVHTPDFAALKSGGWVPAGSFPEHACAAWAG